MPLAKDLQDYIKSQIDYYTEEAASYKQIAEGYVPEIDSVTEIIGCQMVTQFLISLERSFTIRLNSKINPQRMVMFHVFESL